MAESKVALLFVLVVCLVASANSQVNNSEPRDTTLFHLFAVE